MNKKDSEIFHFLEFVPQQNFNLTGDWKWCLQPWYYSPYLLNLEFTNFFCGYCKRLSFDRGQISSENFHQTQLQGHNGSSMGGETCRNFRQSKDQHEFLMNNNICFHMGVPDKKYLMKNKIYQGFTDMGNHSLYKDFETIFRNSKFPVITENFLKKFWI